MPRNILARADALMQRRRQVSSELDDVPVLIDAIDPESDIPILLDVELPVAALQARDEPEAIAAPVSEPVSEPVTTVTVDGEILGDIAHELARRVHDRLAAELPKIVEMTIRDILAEPDIRKLLG